MLIGTYLGSMSSSRRVALPKKFLAEIGENPVLAKWYEDCLILVSSNFWEKLSNRLIGSRNTINLGVRDIERFILGSAYELEPDEQGRIIIPENLAHFAKLEKEVVFLGLLDRVELWSKGAWESRSSGLEGSTREYIEDIAKNEKR